MFLYVLLPVFLLTAFMQLTDTDTSIDINENTKYTSSITSSNNAL